MFGANLSRIRQNGKRLTSDTKKFALKLKSLLESVAKNNISPRFDSFWEKRFYFALTFITFELSLKPVVLIRDAKKQVVFQTTVAFLTLLT